MKIELDTDQIYDIELETLQTSKVCRIFYTEEEIKKLLEISIRSL